MLSEDIIIKGCLFAHVAVSTVSSSVRTIHALSVYFFSVALLLLAILILFTMHWRYEVVKSKKKFRSDNLDSADSPLTEHLFTNCQLKYYDKFDEREASLESFPENYRYSQYDNNLSSEFDGHNSYLRKNNIV